ncbi:MAG: hypothetical protein CMO80_03090 [Verrucomicrobiales bacterium]|nr:hypothetical protein [Verrucomicrobiales bacterium]
MKVGPDRDVDHNSVLLSARLWWVGLLSLLTGMVIGIAGYTTWFVQKSESHNSPKLRLQVPPDDVLNNLAKALNGLYGSDGTYPRLNCGPCGPFALEFQQAWNHRFMDRVHLSYIMTADHTHCYHVLLKLPDGRYYDGGNGVMHASQAVSLYPNSVIDDRSEFDLQLLHHRTGGLNRPYPLCPNYDHDTVRTLIIRHLDGT